MPYRFYLNILRKFMKNSDIRSFFNLKPGDKKGSQDTNKQSAPSSQQNTQKHAEIQKDQIEKKRKSDQFNYLSQFISRVDEELRTEHDTKKRLKKIRDLEELNEMGKESKTNETKVDKPKEPEYKVIDYEEQAKNKQALGLDKAKVIFFSLPN